MVVECKRLVIGMKVVNQDRRSCIERYNIVAGRNGVTARGFCRDTA